jgi:hypothetical protein
VYYSPYIVGDKIEKNEMDGTCSTYGERGCIYRVFVRNPKRKKPLGET